jgi:hypothetical protein
MQQFGGKDSKCHFTVVMGNKEHGLYVSSTPSSDTELLKKLKEIRFSVGNSRNLMFREESNGTYVISNSS